MIKFEPLTKTSQDEFNIIEDDKIIGTFYWKRNHPKPNDKVGIVRDLDGGVAIVPNEHDAVAWLKKCPNTVSPELAILAKLIDAIINRKADVFQLVVQEAITFLDQQKIKNEIKTNA